MKSSTLLAAILTISLLLSSPSHAADPLPDRDLPVNTSYATKAATLDDPMRLVVTVKDPDDPSKTIDKDVTVTDIPKYTPPTKNLGETDRAYTQRAIKALEDHSKLKAERIAQAINTELGDGRATASQNTELGDKNRPGFRGIVPGDAQPTSAKNGHIDVKGCYNITYGVSKKLQDVRKQEIKDAKAHNAKPENKDNQIPVPKPYTTNTTGEVDTNQSKPGQPLTPPKGSMGAKATMGTLNYDLALEFPGEFPNLPMIATGHDEDGNPSSLEFGILDRFVASITPQPGQTDQQLYLLLESLLDAGGLPASYDPATRTLSLDDYFFDDDFFLFGTTDTGLGDYLTASYGIVPEPTTLTLLTIATLTAANTRRRTLHRLPTPCSA